MGLNQMWLAEDKKTGKKTSFATHRKFNALEGFMADQWFLNGNKSIFNVKELPITEKIIEELETKIKTDTLEPRSGFFFGPTEKDEWYQQDIKTLTKEILPAVKEHIKEGTAVYYTSWW